MASEAEQRVVAIDVAIGNDPAKVQIDPTRCLMAEIIRARSQSWH